MYAGRVVEQGTLDELFYDPQHPYTWGLLGSITRIDGDRSRHLPAIPGSPPSLMNPPTGCHFRPRCPHAFDEVRRGATAASRSCRTLPSTSIAAGSIREEKAARGVSSTAVRPRARPAAVTA